MASPAHGSRSLLATNSSPRGEMGKHTKLPPQRQRNDLAHDTCSEEATAASKRHAATLSGGTLPLAVATCGACPTLATKPALEDAAGRSSCCPLHSGPGRRRAANCCCILVNTENGYWATQVGARGHAYRADSGDRPGVDLGSRQGPCDVSIWGRPSRSTLKAEIGIMRGR